MKKKRILIVDDALLSRTLIVNALMDEYDVLEAEDGQEALNILEILEQSVDMVVSDILMPKMDGFQLLEAIKKNSTISHLPVVIVTAMDDLSSELKALNLGAIDVIVKPIHAGITRQRIKNLLCMSDMERIQAENQILKVYQDMKIQLQAILNSSMGGILRVQYGLEVDRGFGELLYANDAFFDLRGVSRDGEDTSEIGYVAKFAIQEDFDHVNELIRKAILEKARKAEGELRIRRPDGSVRYLHSIAAITYLDGGIVLDIIETDVTEQKEAEATLRENQAFLESFLNEALPHTRIKVWKYDIREKKIISNSRDEKKTVITHVPDSFFACDCIHQGSIEDTRQMYHLLEEGEKIVEGTFLCRPMIPLPKGMDVDKLEEYWWEHVTYTTIFDSGGKPISAIGISENVTEQMEAKRKYQLEVYHSTLLRKLAEHDSLTGLLNRATFEQVMDQIIDMREPQITSAMLMIDADNFKLINDNFGHDYGDQVLVTLARRLENCFLTDGIAARIGGDEFAVFMEDVRSETYLLQKLQRVHQQLNFQFESPEGRVTVSGSIGVVLSPEHGMSFKQLYSKADKALYDAKAQGKNRFVFYK